MTGILLAITLGLSPAAGFAGEDEAKKHGWFTDYDQALAEARRQNRLMLAVFR